MEMRKIGSVEEEARKRKRNQMIIGVVLIFVMFFSVVGYSFQGEGNVNNKKIVYNGFEFIQQNEFWLTNIGGAEFSFKYNPREIEKLSSYVNTIDSYYNRPLYISSDNVEVKSEVYRNLIQIVQRIQEACLEGEKCEGDFPYKTCKDNMIIIKEGVSNSIKQEENCVFIESKKEDLLKVTDEFLFKVLKVE